jgi:hypothetical protein
VLDLFLEVDFFQANVKSNAWRKRLAARPAVQQVVSPDYSQELLACFAARDSILGWMANAQLA